MKWLLRTGAERLMKALYLLCPMLSSIWGKQKKWFYQQKCFLIFLIQQLRPNEILCRKFKVTAICIAREKETIFNTWNWHSLGFPPGKGNESENREGRRKEKRSKAHDCVCVPHIINSGVEFYPKGSREGLSAWCWVDLYCHSVENKKLDVNLAYWSCHMAFPEMTKLGSKVRFCGDRITHSFRNYFSEKSRLCL